MAGNPIEYCEGLEEALSIVEEHIAISRLCSCAKLTAIKNALERLIAQEKLV